MVELRRVGLKDRLSVASPKKLKVSGIFLMGTSAFVLIVSFIPWPTPLPTLLAAALPIIMASLFLAGLWLLFLASLSSSFEKGLSKYVSSAEVSKIEEDVESELPLDLKNRELVRKVEVRRRVERLYRMRLDQGFLESLKKRFKFKSGEEVLTSASMSTSGSASIMFLLPFLILSSIILMPYTGWSIIILMLLMILFFSSSSYAELYLVTNRRLIKRTRSSTFLRRVDRSEELKWSTVREVKVKRGRRKLKVKVVGEGETVNIEKLKPSDTERLLKFIEEQVALARKG